MGLRIRLGEFFLSDLIYLGCGLGLMTDFDIEGIVLSMTGRRLRRIMRFMGVCPSMSTFGIVSLTLRIGCVVEDADAGVTDTGHITYHVHEILAKGVADFLHAQS